LTKDAVIYPFGRTGALVTDQPTPAHR